MQLMRCCAVPLLVTGGRSWRPSTKFAGAIDLDGHDPALTEKLVDTVRFLALGSGGEHTLIYGSSVEAIKKFIEEHQVDVLAIGGPKAESWQGPDASLTERLLSMVECDVLIVPASEASSTPTGLLS